MASNNSGVENPVKTGDEVIPPSYLTESLAVLHRHPGYRRDSKRTHQYSYKMLIVLNYHWFDRPHGERF